MPIGLQCTCGTLSVLRVVVSTLVLTSAINDYTGHNSMSWLIFFFSYEQLLFVTARVIILPGP